MIQPQLLAIGNIVQYKNLKGRITLLKQDPTYWYWAVGFASLSSGFGCIEDPKEFNPIPLDAEILQSCGFKLEHTHTEDGDEIEYFRKGNFLYRIGKGLEFGPLMLISVKFLHELQNDYYNLSGQRLEIKL